MGICVKDIVEGTHTHSCSRSLAWHVALRRASYALGHVQGLKLKTAAGLKDDKVWKMHGPMRAICSRPAAKMENCGESTIPIARLHRVCMYLERLVRAAVALQIAPRGDLRRTPAWHNVNAFHALTMNLSHVSLC